MTQQIVSGSSFFVIDVTAAGGIWIDAGWLQHASYLSYQCAGSRQQDPNKMGGLLVAGEFPSVYSQCGNAPLSYNSQIQRLPNVAEWVG